MPPTIRPTVRALIVDGARVLLLHVDDPSATRGLNPLPRSDFWLLPGGGVESGETNEQALRRELREELGLTDVTLGPQVGARNKVVSWGEHDWDVRERYFAARINSGVITFDHLTEPEVPIFRKHHWWSATEIAGSTDLFVPPELTTHVAAAIDAMR